VAAAQHATSDRCVEFEMDAFQTPGAFSWCELMTTEPQAAVEHYRQLFGWSVDVMDVGGGPYHVLKVGDSAIGGIMGMPPGAPPMPPRWVSYVTVADVDATAEKCTALGGKVLMGPTDIPTVGRFAVLQDRQGAELNVITYVPRG
jgi:predicted enzyme related to lactoylglutathione lyase